jgi:hypothetical protein
VTNSEFKLNLAAKVGKPAPVQTKPPSLSPRAEAVVSRLRTRCTVCYTPVSHPAELEPGTGRCKECMP